MCLLVGTLVEVVLCYLGELRVPDEVLGAVQPAPVPVSPHHSANEGGVVAVRGNVVHEVARLDVVHWGSDRRSSREGDERGRELHEE